MSFLRGLNKPVASFNSTLTLPVTSASPGDCMVLFLEGVDWASHNAGSPIIPDYFREMYLNVHSGGFKYLGYAKVPAQGVTGGAITLTVGAGMTTSGGWWGHVDVIGGVAWQFPGYVTSGTTGANYATYTRSDIASASTSYSIWAQVEFVGFTVGTTWFTGWANGDMGFGINSSLRPVAFINNTLGNPIGNAAANADVPRMTVDKKIWLRADIDVATANCSYYYSYDPTPNFDSVLGHWTQIGTTVTGTNAATTPRVTNSDTVFLGTRNTGIDPFGGKVFALVEVANGVLTVVLNFSDPTPAGLTLLGTADHIRSTDQDIGNLPFDNYAMCDGFCFSSLTDFSLPAINVLGTDRFAFAVLRGGVIGEHTQQPVTGPVDWTAWRDRATSALGLRIKEVTRTRRTNTDLPAAQVAADGNYSWQYHWISFVEHTTVIELPPFPLIEVMRLGCADSYTVWVTDQDYATTIDQFRWSAIQWERVLDDVSTASVTIPDELGGVDCLARLGGLQPWAYGLLLERNDQEVWRGPIRNVKRQADTIVVSAADTLARMQKRFAIRSLVVPYTNADAGRIFADIINIHSHQPADPWILACPTITVNVPVTRTLRPRSGKYAWDLLSELLDTAIDAYMMNGVLYVWEPNRGWRYKDQITRTVPGPYNDSFELVYGTFTEDAFSERPDWSIDGAGQGNYVLSATTDTGELGFRQFQVAQDVLSQETYGVLDLLDPSPLEVPEDQTPRDTSNALKARSQSLLRLRSMAPVVMEGGALSQAAPIDMANLRPGGLWVTDIFDQGYGQLLSVVRLRRVNVSVTMGENGISETISPTLYPPGWSGDMGDA